MRSVSIIIPVYKLPEGNNRLFFDQLINSIATNLKTKKSFNINEIIVVNDSPDSYKDEIIKNTFEQNDISHLLKLKLNETNRGQGFCRNLGSTFATGDYLHFIDQDDYIAPNFYETLSRYESNIIMADLGFYNHEIEGGSYYKWFTKIIYNSATKISSLLFFLITNIAVSPGQYLIKANVFKKVNGFPDLKNKGSDDYGILFNLSLLKEEITFNFCTKTKLFYRIHGNQGSKSLVLDNSLNEFFKNFIISKLTLMHKLIKFVRTNKNLALVRLCFYLIFFNRSK